MGVSFSYHVNPQVKLRCVGLGASTHGAISITLSRYFYGKLASGIAPLIFSVHRSTGSFTHSSAIFPHQNDPIPLSGCTDSLNGLCVNFLSSRRTGSKIQWVHVTAAHLFSVLWVGSVF